MKDLGQRIVYLMKVKGLNPNKLGVLTGIHPSTIKNYRDNIGKPDNAKLDKISSVLDISNSWLKNGTGVMEIENKATSSQNENDNDITVVSRLAKMLEDAYEEIKILRQEIERKKNN